MKYGYARCSTNEDKQDIQRQIRELKAAGAEEVIFEYEHGDANVKKNLSMLLAGAKEGDTIITLEVSRLSRSTQQLCEIVETIKKKRLCGANQAVHNATNDAVRFIPTHVGPIFLLLTPGAPISGSSPRMWGQLNLRTATGFIQRFIPTHVGPM